MKYFIIVTFLLGFNPSMFSQQLTEIEKLEGLSQIWKEVEYNYYNYYAQNVNWDSLYYSNIKKVIETDSDKEYFKIISEFLAVFHEGHTYVYVPKDIHNKVGAKIWPFYTGNKVYIIGIGNTLKDSIPIGSELLKVNNISVLDYLDSLYYKFNYPKHVKYQHLIKKMFYDENKTKYSVKIKLPNSIIKNITFAIDLNDVWHKVYNPVKHYNKFHFELLEDEISYINFGNNLSYSSVEDFESVLDSIKITKGIVFDLRNNRGGNSIASLICKYFSTDSIIYPYIIETRENIATKRANGLFIEKYSDYYSNNSYKRDTAKYINDSNIFLDIPVVFLTNENTISAAETFVISFKSIEKGYVIGKPTRGSSSFPLTIKLPKGAYARIATQRMYYYNGDEYTYINPDILVEPTIDEIIEGKDVVLNKAIELLIK